MKRITLMALGATLLTACSVGEEPKVDDLAPPAPVSSISGQVQNYSGPAGVLSATRLNDIVEAGEGTVDAAGTFSFALSDTFSEGVLDSVTVLYSDCVKSGLELDVSNNDVKIFSLGTYLPGELAVIADGNVEGTLQSLRLFQGEPPPETFYPYKAYIYVDNDVTIKGTCETLSTIPPFTFNLNLVKGWNVYSVVFGAETPERPYGNLIESGPLEGAKWYYSAR